MLGAEPDEVVKPTTVEEVAACVARASRAGKAVIPWGGGTAQDYGYAPRRADIVLNLSDLNQIIAHEPGDLTITVQAGATLSQIQQTLAVHRQFLPLDPPDRAHATVGGILATNAWGPLRLGYGTARDWLIGLTVVDAQGRLIKGGGKVVKNVTGYDLPKLYVGALGTLGVTVEATFKVAPQPEAFAVWNGELKLGENAAVFTSRLQNELLPVSSVLFDKSGLHVAFAGPEETIESSLAVVQQIASECGIGSGPVTRDTNIAEPLAVADLEGMLFQVGFSGCASDAYGQHEALSTMGFDRLVTFLGVGYTEAAADDDAVVAKAITWAKERQTRVTLVKAPLAVRQNGEVWWPLPPGFALMRRTKEALDPDNTLNPGRFVGRL